MLNIMPTHFGKGTVLRDRRITYSTRTFFNMQTQGANASLVLEIAPLVNEVLPQKSSLFSKALH